MILSIWWAKLQTRRVSVASCEHWSKSKGCSRLGSWTLNMVKKKKIQLVQKHVCCRCMMTWANSSLHVGCHIPSEAGWPPQVETIVLNICAIDKVKEPMPHSLLTSWDNNKAARRTPEFYCYVKSIGRFRQRLWWSSVGVSFLNSGDLPQTQADGEKICCGSSLVMRDVYCKHALRFCWLSSKRQDLSAASRPHTFPPRLDCHCYCVPLGLHTQQEHPRTFTFSCHFSQNDRNSLLLENNSSWWITVTSPCSHARIYRETILNYNLVWVILPNAWKLSLQI